MFDEIEYKAKRLAAEGARLNANGTAVVNAAQQELVDHGSICKSHLGIHNVRCLIVENQTKIIISFFSNFVLIKFNVLHQKNHC